MDPAALALLIYSTQILLVVSVAALAATSGRISIPAVRLAYWRGVGTLCLALPLLRPGQPEPAALSVAFSSETTITGVVLATAPAATTPGSVILWIWAIGTVTYFAWLQTGAWRLRRLRRRSTPAALRDEIDSLRLSLAPRAEFRWSRDVEQPVTFGIRRPIVLLPERFDELSDEGQRAVACHELHHVARRDWIWIVLEEHARALFWFHPGAWWLVDQLQLAREQVVDQLVVSDGISKRAYMTTLLTFADRPGVALSIAFLRRRHLKSRFQQLSKEPHMSLTRLAWTTALLAVLIGSAALGAARALPLDVPALGLQNRAGVQLEIRLAETAPAAGLREAAVPGSDQRVYLHQATLATDADVTGASVINMGAQFGVGVRFSDAASARMLNETKAHLGKPLAIVLDGDVIAAPTLRAPIGDSAVISGTFTAVSAQELATKLAPMRSPQNGAARPDLTLPVPVYEQRPYYTQAALAAQIHGSVLLETVVLADGSVGDVRVVKSLDSEFGLDQQAVDAMKMWTFKPGTRDGEPVRVAVQVEMTFTLK
jgi:TonB family protein